MYHGEHSVEPPPLFCDWYCVCRLVILLLGFVCEATCKLYGLPWLMTLFCNCSAHFGQRMLTHFLAYGWVVRSALRSAIFGISMLCLLVAVRCATAISLTGLHCPCVFLLLVLSLLSNIISGGASCGTGCRFVAARAVVECWRARVFRDSRSALPVYLGRPRAP